jgi:phage head maturation protease
MADSKAPYGPASEANYADPGYQKDGKKRYPLNSEARAKAAWSYINQADNAGKYSSEHLAAIKGRIKAALKKFGVQVAADSASRWAAELDDAAAWLDELQGVSRTESSTHTPNPFEVFGGAPMFMRSFPLEDIHIKRGGDGRTVEAYAAVFNVEAEIQDFEGHYNEVVDPVAFDKAIGRARPQNGGQGWRVGVFYNHGLTIHGTPSERGSMPLGTPEDIRPDSRGLLTVSRYSKTEQADEVLELINSGAINAQSFTGRLIRSDPALSRSDRRRGGYTPVNGQLQTVRRLELGLTEYGPTPMPAYQSAAIMGVRAFDARYNQQDPDEDQAPDASDESVTDPNPTGNRPDPSQAQRRRRIAMALRARGISDAQDTKGTRSETGGH